MKYYKVTTDDMCSAFTYNIPYCSVQYKQNEWVVSHIPYSKLFVFDNLNDAIDYGVGCGKKCIIWECEVKNPSVIKHVSHTDVSFDFEEVVKFWKNKHQKKANHFNVECNPFRGSVVVDAVKLVKGVNWIKPSVNYF